MARIKKIDERLVGQEVWYLDPWLGIKKIKVTGIYHVQGHRGEDQWGLYFDMEHSRTHHIYSRILWLREFPVFDERGALVQYYHKLLKVDRLAEFRDLEEEGIDVRK